MSSAGLSAGPTTTGPRRSRNDRERPGTSPPPWRRRRQPVDHRSPTKPNAEVLCGPPSRGPHADQGSHAAGGRCPRPGRGQGHRRPRGVRVGPGPPARRHPHLEELHRTADRGGRPRPRRAGDPVLRRWRPLPVRRPDAGRHGLHRRRLDVGRVPGVEGRGPRVRDAGRPLRRAEGPLQPPPADPGGRLGRPGAAARLEGIAYRRRWPRLAGGAVPRGGGGRHDRHRRLRCRRRQQPPAPDHPHDRPGGGAQGRIRRSARSTP